MTSDGIRPDSDIIARADSFASAHALDEFEVLPRHHADRQLVVRLLNATLAAEMSAALRYRRHHFMISGSAAATVKKQLLQHAAEEELHADLMARRIVQLGGEPDIYPMERHDCGHCDYVEGEAIAALIHEDLIAEYAAIASCGEVVRYLDDSDPTTRRMLEGIAAVKGEHASQLAAMLERLFGNDRT